MNSFYLTALVQEMTPSLLGGTVASVAISGPELKFGLKTRPKRDLVLILDRSRPSLFLSSKPEKEARRERAAVSPFALLLRKHLFGAKVSSVTKHPRDRIVEFGFAAPQVDGQIEQLHLVVELTGRRANALFCDKERSVLDSMFPAERLRIEPIEASSEHSGAMISPGDRDETELLALVHKLADRQSSEALQLGPVLRAELAARASALGPIESLRSMLRDLSEAPAVPSVYSRLRLDGVGDSLIDLKTELILSHIDLEIGRGLQRYRFDTLSEAAEAYWRAFSRARVFNDSFKRVRQSLVREVSKVRAVLEAIEDDRRRFGRPEKLRRDAELLLANLANARVTGGTAAVIDYYDPAQPEIQIEVGEGATLQQAASRLFKRYQKASRALTAIDSRKQQVTARLGRLDFELDRLDKQPTGDGLAQAEVAAVELGLLKPKSASKKARRPGKRGGEHQLVGRRFRSSDGYEVLVGRNDRENDALTFRVARSNDVWLHAADYPGSHVIIRNHSRKEVPQRTIGEAAELAALNSQAKRAPKVAVHYTLKKSVSRPPNAKPGLVRLSSYKTLLVEPRCRLEKLNSA